MRMFIRAVPGFLASRNLAERHRHETHEQYDKLTSKESTDRKDSLPLLKWARKEWRLRSAVYGRHQAVEGIDVQYFISESTVTTHPPIPDVLNPFVDIRRSRSRYPWTTTTPSHTAISPHWKHENKWVWARRRV